MGKVKEITATLGAPDGGPAALLSALAAGGARIRALQIEGGKARFVVDDPERALAALREAGIEGWLGEVLAIAQPSDPEAIAAVVEGLARAGVGVETAYTGSSDRTGGGILVLAVSDLETALRVTGGA